MSDPLYSAKLKVERADRHIKELKTFLPQMGESRRYRFVLDQDEQAESGQFVRLELAPPRGIESVIMGDVIYQLRSALDVAAVAMARVNKPNCGVSDVYFPFAKDRADLLNMGTRGKRGTQFKINKLSPRARNVINGLQPYPGGNDLLWSLNALRNEDAHIELIAAAGAITNLVRIDFGGPPDDVNFAAVMAGALAAAAGGKPIYDGLTIKLPNGCADAAHAVAVINRHAKLSTTICFNHPDVLNGQPVITTLEQMRDLVSEIIRLLNSTI